MDKPKPCKATTVVWDSTKPRRSGLEDVYKNPKWSWSRRCLRDLEWEVHVPDADFRALEDKEHFLPEFLSTRPITSTSPVPVSTLLVAEVETIKIGQSYYERYSLKMELSEIIRKQRRVNKENWRLAFHWAQWSSVYGILINGCQNTPGRGGADGVWTHDCLQRGGVYPTYTIFPDGIARCVYCELLID